MNDLKVRTRFRLPGVIFVSKIIGLGIIVFLCVLLSNILSSSHVEAPGVTPPQHSEINL